MLASASAPTGLHTSTEPEICSLRVVGEGFADCSARTEVCVAGRTRDSHIRTDFSLGTAIARAKTGAAGHGVMWLNHNDHKLWLQALQVTGYVIACRRETSIFIFTKSGR